jgi:hypothetical protein
MPIVPRHTHQHLIAQIKGSVDDLLRLLALRDLRGPSEGASERAPWPHPEQLGVTFGSDEAIRIAIDTLKAPLAELKKIKSHPAPKVYIHPRNRPVALPTATPIFKP